MSPCPEKGTLNFFLLFSFFKINSPGWCGSVDLVLAWEPKGRWFDSQSGHMPGLQEGPQQGACERQPHIDVSLHLFLLPFSFL